jgi:beta-galactosidase
MNSWTNIRPGGFGGQLRGGLFAIYRAHFTPRPAGQKAGGTLVLRAVTGKAQVYIDGKLAGEKTTTQREDLKVAFPAGEGERTVSVLVEAASTGGNAGLGGTVTVE